MLILGNAMSLWRQGVCGDALYFPLDFVENAKLLLKKNPFKKMKKKKAEDPNRYFSKKRYTKG